MTLNEFISRFILPRMTDTTTTNTNNPKMIDQRDSESEIDFMAKKQKISHQSFQPSDSSISSSSVPMGYLAQHCLFDHIRILRSHFTIPDYCSLLKEDDEIEGNEEIDENDVIMNGWFGPIGTVSPLHHDPYHNLLAQVHGLFLIITTNLSRC